MKLVLKSENGDLKIDAIGFKMGHYANLITGTSFSISYVIDENEWRGKKTLQLVLKDIKIER